MLFQAFTLLALSLTFRKWRFLFSLKHLCGFAVFALVVGSYLYLFHQKDDVLGFLMRQTKEAAEKSAAEAHWSKLLKQFLTFPFQYLKILLPWSLLVVFFFEKGMLKKIRDNKLLLFSIYYILLNIPIYWISGYFKPRYLYMFLPFSCLILIWMYWHSERKLKQRVEGFFTGLVKISPLLILLGLIYAFQLHYIENYWLKGTIVLLLSLIVLFINVKKNVPFLSLVIMLAVFRLGWNFIYIPNHFKNASFEEFEVQLERVLANSNGEQIYLYDYPYILNSKVDLRVLELEHELVTAPQLQFRIPFYVAKGNNKVMQFVEEMEADKYYLVREDREWAQNREELGRFFDNFSDKHWILIKTESKE